GVLASALERRGLRLHSSLDKIQRAKIIALHAAEIPQYNMVFIESSSGHACCVYAYRFRWRVDLHNPGHTSESHCIDFDKRQSGTDRTLCHSIAAHDLH